MTLYKTYSAILHCIHSKFQKLILCYHREGRFYWSTLIQATFGILGNGAQLSDCHSQWLSSIIQKKIVREGSDSERCSKINFYSDDNVTKAEKGNQNHKSLQSFLATVFIWLDSNHKWLLPTQGKTEMRKSLTLTKKEHIGARMVAKKMGTDVYREIPRLSQGELGLRKGEGKRKSDGEMKCQVLLRFRPQQKTVTGLQFLVARTKLYKQGGSLLAGSTIESPPRDCLPDDKPLGGLRNHFLQVSPMDKPTQPVLWMFIESPLCN